MASQIANTLASANALFQEVYADKIQDVRPKGFKLQRMIPFKNPRLGLAWNQPVALTHEAGFTYHKASAEDLPSGAVGIAGIPPRLLGALGGLYKNARLDSFQMFLQSQTTYEAIARSAKGREAFRQVYDVVVENMQISAAKRLEINLWCGQSSLGKIASVSFGGALGTDTITLNEPDNAPGMWTGMIGAMLEAWSAVTETATKRTIAASNNLNYFSVTKVDLTTTPGQVILTVVGNGGTTAGTADNQVDIAGTDTIAANDFIYFRGARSATEYLEFAGIEKVLTTAGTLFGIDNSVYELWRPAANTAGGALSYTLLTDLISDLVNKGLDEDVHVFMNPEVLGDLLVTEVSRIRHIGEKAAGVRYEIGANGIKFYSQNGTLTCESCLFCKKGFVFVIVPSDWKRVGATDITFQLPDTKGPLPEYFLHLPTQAGYELRNMSHQALFCKAPGRQGYLSGITT